MTDGLTLAVYGPSVALSQINFPQPAVESSELPGSEG